MIIIPWKREVNENIIQIQFFILNSGTELIKRALEALAVARNHFEGPPQHTGDEKDEKRRYRENGSRAR